MQYRCKWKSATKITEFLLKNFILLSIFVPFLAVTWGRFFNSSVDDKIRPMQEIANNEPNYMDSAAVEIFREGWIALFNTIEGMMVGMLILSVIVFLFYRRMNEFELFNMQQRYNYTVMLLEYIIRLKSEEENKGSGKR